ncbi:MAG: AHH domain-containing protein [Hyphomicrobiaceae bacterium]|nr:AHH domain-containing protein [Hyphomicrobiaceae bacterium]
MTSFKDTTIPPVPYGDIIVNFAKHHAIPEQLLTDNRKFFEALKERGFDGHDFRANGIPLPRSISGGATTGLAIHIDAHPAFSDWIAGLLKEDLAKFNLPNHGGLDLDATASKLAGLKAYIQTELMNPDSPLALNWRDLPSAEQWERYTPAQKDAIRSQFAAINWEGVQASDAYKIATSIKNGGLLFDATPGSNTAFDVSRPLSVSRSGRAEGETRHPAN